MAASLRELRQRRQSVTATKKITKAMELIASSRVIKAQQAAARALPFTRELNRAVSAVAEYSHVDHPLTREGLRAYLTREPEFRLLGDYADGDAACGGARQVDLEAESHVAREADVDLLTRDQVLGACHRLCSSGFRCH